ncbi:MAG: NAD-dependent epimerase/dehydratase family protein [Anaerolineales bacterium]|nr:NAD-dependent epimerase/dehydratase family protein [Anaerolineales bacterium]
MTQNNLHVVFGTGALGKWTARELVRLGKPVRMISHSGKADARIPAGVEVVKGDAYDTKNNIEVTKGAEAVYQCAQPQYHEWAEKFPPMQKAILDAVATNGAKYISGDNLYMYGDTNGQPIREDMPYQPHTKKGKVRGAMADAVMEAHRAGKVRAAIGRASNFFGPDDMAVTSFAIRPALAGKAINLLGRTDQPHTFSYIADFGKLLATLGTREDTLGQIWFAPSPAPVTQNDLVKIMEEVLGQKVKVMAAGKMMLSMLGLFVPAMRESVEMLYEWDKPFIMDSSKAEKAFGWKGTPLKEAMQATIEWCKSDPGKH